MHGRVLEPRHGAHDAAPGPVTVGELPVPHISYHRSWIAPVSGDLKTTANSADAAKAEAYFERALSVARQQQAKSWELRAAMSFARLWRDQGKRDEARDLLAPVYGWFTEGHNTRDLKEAKALLEEFAA